MAANTGNANNIRAVHEKVISSKVVNKKSGVLGAISSPFSFLKKFGASITGIFSGCVMLVIAVGLILAAVFVVPDNSRKVESLDLLTVDQAKDAEGLVKVQGEAKVISPAMLSYSTKNEYGQKVDNTFHENAIYLFAEYEIYEQIKDVSTETQTVVENGEEIQKEVETTEISEDWVSKDTIEVYANFTLGEDGIEVETEKIDQRFETQEEIVKSVVLPSGETPQVYENPSPQIGDTRLTVKYVPSKSGDGDSLEFLLVGDVKDGKMGGGDVFMISNYSDSELVEKLSSEESSMRWVIRFIAWLLMTAGFTAIVGPVIVLANLIPGLNKVMGCATSVVFGTLSAVIIFIITFLTTYWWLALLCTGGLGVLALVVSYFLLKRSK